MRLTTYTDYTLRVLIFLTLKYQRGQAAAAAAPPAPVAKRAYAA